jgi:hypothetical protein
MNWDDTNLLSGQLVHWPSCYSFPSVKECGYKVKEEEERWKGRKRRDQDS